MTTAYVDQADVEAYLGRVLTAAELVQLDDACDAATELIDRYCGRSWQASVVAAELHTVLGPTVRLDHAPVSAISLVRTRPQAIGATWTTLTADETYELLDAASGVLLLSGTYDAITTTDASVHGRIIAVSYTVGDGVPAPIKLAAEMLVGSLLVAGATAGSAGSSAASLGIKKWTVDAESIEYDTSGTASASSSTAALGASGRLPADARSLLDAYRTPVLFA